MSKEKSENQRLREALDHLKNLKIIKVNTDLAKQIGIDKNRINYLTKDNGGKFTAPEVNLLKQNFPEVNWNYVISGTGSIENNYKSNDDLTLVKEADMIYRNNPDHQQKINLILTGESPLSETEQMELLKKEVLKLQQKVINIYESTNPFSILKDLKRLIQ